MSGLSREAYAACERGDPELRPQLWIDEELNGLVVYPVEGEDEPCKFYLAPRFVKAWVVTLEAWNDQVGRPDEIRGYRTTDYLGDQFAGLTEGQQVALSSTVGSYVETIRSELRAALAKQFGAAAAKRLNREPFESKRGWGYRIGPAGLVVHVHASSTWTPPLASPAH